MLGDGYLDCYLGCLEGVFSFGFLINLAMCSAVDFVFVDDDRLHSHTTKTRQPSNSSACTTLISLATFFWNLFSQKSVLLFGVVAMLHPGCRCQKHPWTNTIALYLGNTISGLPGNPAPCRR